MSLYSNAQTIFPIVPKLNPIDVIAFSCILNKIEIFDKIEENSIQIKSKYHRNPQTPELLNQISKALTPLTEPQAKWLQKRSIHDHSNIYGIDLELLTHQDLLDLFIIPLDHVIEHHGLKAVEGLVFPDIRDGVLHGICIRNLSGDLPFVAAAKYTFSNFNYYLYNYDSIDKDDTIAICEGVFDVKALESIHKKVVSLGAAYPTSWQLACIKHKTSNVEVYMDNDFQGWCGAYAIAKCFNKAYVFLPEHKDPAEEILESKNNKFNKVSLEKLESKILLEIPLYNERMRDLKYDELHFHRNLKYN